LISIPQLFENFEISIKILRGLRS